MPENYVRRTDINRLVGVGRNHLPLTHTSQSSGGPWLTNLCSPGPRARTSPSSPTEDSTPPAPFPCDLYVISSRPSVRWEAISQVQTCNMQSFLGEDQMGDLYLRMIWKAVESKTAVVFAEKYFTTQTSVTLCRR